MRYREIFRIIRWRRWILLSTLALALSGCSLSPTAPNAKDVPPVEEVKTVDAQGWNTLMKAVEQSAQITRFGMSGTLYTQERGKTHRSAIYGNVILPDEIVMSQNVDGRSYYIYQDQTASYYRADGAWRPSTRVQLPNPWTSLERLKQLAPPTVYRLKDDPLLNAKVYQFTADAVPLSGITDAQVRSLPTLYTFWIDQKTHYIRQIKLESTSSMDDVGTFVTYAAVQFFSINDENLKIEMPPDLKNQLKVKGQGQ